MGRKGVVSGAENEICRIEVGLHDGVWSAIDCHQLLSPFGAAQLDALCPCLPNCE
jgi:hypothetical protein